LGVRTDLELRHFRAFVTVVDTGSHTRAARSLGVSQSTVSETLSSLERALGAALLRKGGKGPALTASGKALLPYARRLLALSSEAVAELAKVSTQMSATLVVSAVESLSAYVLPTRLPALRARWPKTRVEIVTGACPEIRASVAAGTSDVGLVLEEGRGDDDGSVLAEARLVVFGCPAHPLARRGESAEELARCDFFMCDAGGDYHQVLRHHFEAAEVVPPRTQALGTVEGVKRGILAGGPALGLLPEHAVTQELADGSLAEIAVRPPLPRLVLRAIVSSEGAASPIVASLLDSVRGAPLVEQPAPRRPSPAQKSGIPSSALTMKSRS
jgi:DNA-binding transcriptional LysR family regulator